MARTSQVGMATDGQGCSLVNSGWWGRKRMDGRDGRRGSEIEREISWARVQQVMQKWAKLDFAKYGWMEVGPST